MLIWRYRVGVWFFPVCPARGSHTSLPTDFLPPPSKPDQRRVSAARDFSPPLLATQGSPLGTVEGRGLGGLSPSSSAPCCSYFRVLGRFTCRSIRIAPGRTNSSRRMLANSSHTSPNTRWIRLLVFDASQRMMRRIGDRHLGPRIVRFIVQYAMPSISERTYANDLCPIHTIANPYK
jgi:hypothetical protein